MKTRAVMTTLEFAYNKHLGGFLAISPDLYSKALDAIAKDLGRENDEEFRAEIRAHEITIPCWLD